MNPFGSQVHFISSMADVDMHLKRNTDMSSKNLWELTPEELRATLDASMKQLESEFLQADYDCAWLLARNMTLIDSRELAIEAKVPPKDDD